MDEAEQYQQRLQAIAEKRRQQEEEERVKRETEEEWLKQAQRKRKSLRDQWLMEKASASAPASASASTPAPASAPASADNTAPQDNTESADEQEGSEVKGEDQQRGSNSRDPSRKHPSRQVDTQEEVMRQVMRAAEGQLPWPMTSQMMFHENGQDDRSVLGMVAVQVERDPRTGATTIRSVAPVSGAGAPADGVPAGATVFDDGRKRVLALGGSGGAQPSAEELEQVLSALDGVGMQLVLGEASTSPRGGPRDDEGMEGEPGDDPCGPTQDAPWHEGLAENNESLNSYENPEVEVEIEGCYQSGGEEEDDYGGRHEEGRADDRWLKSEEVEDGDDGAGYRMEAAPVTLTFLGYTEAAEAGQSLGHEDLGGLLKVERVIITDEEEEEEEEEEGGGEEETRHAQGDSFLEESEPSSLSQERGGGGGGGEPGEGLANEHHKMEAFQDVALDGALGREAGQGAELHPLVAPVQAPPSRAEGEEAPPKRKTCQCCSVM